MMQMRKIILLGILIVAAGFGKRFAPEPYHFPELAYFPPMPLAGDNPVTEAGVDLGRHLFYDPILSRDSTLACASCHKQAAAFSDAPNVFSKGHNEALLARNTLPLFNLAWYPTLFWDGRAVSVEEQVFHPVRAHEEMNLQWPVAVQRLKRSNFYKAKFREAFGSRQVDSVSVAKAIAQFERTLLSYRSKYDLVLAGKAFFTQEEYEGFELANDMTKGDCLHCHSSDADPLGTTLGFSNNGLDRATVADDYHDKGRGAITGKKLDYGKFKIPSLRNVALTAPYMHDGRFKKLEEVMDFYSEGVQPGVNTDAKMGMAYQHGVHLTKKEKRKIILFLQTLTDSAFVTDAAFSNPFL